APHMFPPLPLHAPLPIGAVGNRAIGWFEADHADMRGWSAARAARIGADRERDEARRNRCRRSARGPAGRELRILRMTCRSVQKRSEEHTSELQSHLNLVC